MIGTGPISWLTIAALFVLAAVLGTDRLGRPLTDDEKRRFGSLLREHDYPGARLVALRFAYKLARTRKRAKDLMGRADLRLVRFGWDPDRVPLVRCLCRLVWSEWTNATTETAAARRAEEGFLRELEVAGEVSVPSIEQRAVRLEAERASRAEATVQLEKLRAAFEAAGDEVNLSWLKHAAEREPDLQKLAEAMGRDVTELYAAAKRRKRVVRRLLAEARGVEVPDEDA